jgi:uncharacterized protein YjeT (DUF2065 family)
MNTIFGVILIVVGVFNFFYPKKSWWIEGGFLFKSVEPSETSLKMRKMIGGITVVFGLFLLFT